MIDTVERPQTFREAKERGLKKKPDALSEVLLADPISLPIAYMISRYAPVHPLVVSAFAFGARILAAWQFAVGNLVSGAVLAFVGFVLDAVDGKVARMTRRDEVLHGSFDFMLDSLAFVLMGLGLSYWARQAANDWTLLGLLAWMGSVSFFLAVSSTAYRLAAASGITETTRRGAGDAVSRLLEGREGDPTAQVMLSVYRAYVRLWKRAARYRLLPLPNIVDSEVVLFVMAPLFGVPSWLVFLAVAFVLPDIVLVLAGAFALARRG